LKDAEKNGEKRHENENNDMAQPPDLPPLMACKSLLDLVPLQQCGCYEDTKTAKTLPEAADTDADRAAVKLPHRQTSVKGVE
jgi:hypothetical protein